VTSAHVSNACIREAAVVDGVPHDLFIGDEWRAASGGGTLAVEDPATSEPLCEVADATVDDAKAALGAAHGARSRFRKRPRAGALAGTPLAAAWDELRSSAPAPNSRLLSEERACRSTTYVRALPWGDTEQGRPSESAGPVPIGSSRERGSDEGLP